jgi:hypothetical protein
MGDYSKVFLLANVALAFYLVGCIWAHEVDIFPSWKLLDDQSFPHVQQMHWRKLPYWVFAPLGVAFAGSIALVWYHPAGSPAWAIWTNLGLQLLSHVLTALTWGRWQAGLSKDPLGSRSPYLTKILRTHWMRTLIVNAYAVVLFIWMVQVL